MQKLLLRRDVKVASDRRLALIVTGQDPWVPFANAYAAALKREENGQLREGKYNKFVTSAKMTSLDLPGILHFVAKQQGAKKISKKATPLPKPEAKKATEPSKKKKAPVKQQLASTKRPREDESAVEAPGGAATAACGAGAGGHRAGAALARKKPRGEINQEHVQEPATAVRDREHSSPSKSSPGRRIRSIEELHAFFSAVSPSDIAEDEDPGPNESAASRAAVSASPASSRVATAASSAGGVGTAAGGAADLEKRSRSFRKTASAKSAKAITQAKEQRLYVVGEHSCSEAGGTFLVWCKGAMSKVTIGTENACTCPVGSKGDVCKHHMFVMLRALGRREDDVLTWQGGLLRAELQELFTHRPNPLTNGGKTAASKVATADSNAKRCLVVKGDTCPVCFLPIVKGGVEPLEWCRAHCGQNVHSECMRQKAEFHASAQCRVETGSNALPCPYCDTAWVAGPAK